MLQQISAALLTIIQLLLALFGFPAKGTPQPQTDTPCVFVHGLGGWGNYDTVNEVAPYWGMTTGSLLAYLESEGYDCYAASVGPISSAWDRACELYAQLTGTTVDYGAAHSAAHNHDRYGKTYAQPLFSGWGPEKRIHLFGHSFGGATVRLFTQIACEGIQEEIDASPTDVSPFFRGGMDSWIYSVTTLAAPHNGTTMDGAMREDDATGAIYLPLTTLAGAIGNLPVVNGMYDFQLSQFGLTTLPGSYAFNVARLSEMLNFTSSRDHAGYDLSLRGAYDLNCQIKVLLFLLCRLRNASGRQRQLGAHFLDGDDIQGPIFPDRPEGGALYHLIRLGDQRRMAAKRRACQHHLRSAPTFGARHELR